MGDGFCVRRRSGYQPPESLLPSREKVPSACEADEGGFRNGKIPPADRPVSGPCEKEGKASVTAVGVGGKIPR